MSWKTVTFESIDIRDGFVHEIFITGHELVKTVPRAGEKKAGEAHKFSGVEHGRGPVSFLATDSLATDLKESVITSDEYNNKAGEKVGKVDMLPMLVRIQWKGKVAIKGGEQMFNVFACEKYQVLPGDSYPAWTSGSGLKPTIEVKTDDLPEEGPNSNEGPDDPQFEPNR